MASWLTDVDEAWTRPVITLVFTASTGFVGGTVVDYFSADRNNVSIAFLFGLGTAALCTLLVASGLWPAIFDRNLNRREPSPLGDAFAAGTSRRSSELSRSF
ncbi:MAG TPA: hypothetical protein VII51_08015 [Gaiellaceae bacterium]